MTRAQNDTGTAVTRFAWISLVLTVASLAVVAAQIASGHNDARPNDQFSRVFLAGWVANLSTAVLHTMVTRAKWPIGARVLVLALNWLLTAALIFWAATLLWR